MIIAVDTETTGLDLWHGCKPFFVSTKNGDGTVRWWEWDVNPHTREPIIPKRELRDLEAYLRSAETLVFHNTKFDVRALKTIGVDLTPWVWSHLEDTLVASHCISSQPPHGLKPLCIIHGIMDDEDQDALHQAAKEAREYMKKLKWRFAKAGDPHFPGDSRSDWSVYDMWAPKALTDVLELSGDHSWRTVCRDYACKDAERTLELWSLFWPMLEDMDLYEHYEIRRDLLEPLYDMEEAGLPLDWDNIEELQQRFKFIMEENTVVCQKIGGIKNPNSSQQVATVLFDKFGLTPIKLNKTGPSTDAKVCDELYKTLNPRSQEAAFLRSLRKAKSCSTALGFLSSYENYAVGNRLHPNINNTGTGTTRKASERPNGQNVSRKEDYNLRYGFAPDPGEWLLSVDYANIELRMLAYAAGETELIKAFERGESVHMNFAWIICPWAILKLPRNTPERTLRTAKGVLTPEAKKKLEKAFKETDQYHWIKNGDFALTYGATKATVDRSYHIEGGYDKVRGYFTHLDGFMSDMVRIAYRHHRITCLGGYELDIPYGREYTTAVDYYCQGSAGWVMDLAILRLHKFLPEVKSRMLITIHDELLFELPAELPRKDMAQICEIMASPGYDLGVPTPVEPNIITTNWAEPKPIDLSPHYIPL